MKKNTNENMAEYKLVNLVNKNVDRAYSAFLENKSPGDSYRKGLRKFLDLDLESFIDKKVKDYGLNKDSFYKNLSENL